MAAKVASPYHLAWSPLPPQRDGSGTSSTSETSRQSSFPVGRGLKLNMRVRCGAQLAAAPAGAVSSGRADHGTPSPRSSICTLLLRGFASLLQLLPQFLYRFFFQQSLPYLTFSVAASLLCFVSLNIPGTYLMLCAVLGLVAFTILSLSAYTTGAYVAVASSPFAHATAAPANDATPPPPLPPHFSSGASVPLRRHRSAGELPLNFKPKSNGDNSSSGGSSLSASGSSSSPSGLSLRQRRLLRRQQTAARISSLETVPEALAAEHPVPPPTGHLSRPASSGYLLAAAAAGGVLEPPPALAGSGGSSGASMLRELLTADGVPVSDLQLAACVSHLSAGLDGAISTTGQLGSPLSETPFGLSPGASSDGSSFEWATQGGSSGGGVTSICRVDSTDSSTSSAASAAAKTMAGQAYAFGERMWPWVTVPVAVACLPVAVVCTLPVAVPLLCTYGAVRIGVFVVRAGASAVCDYVPGAKAAP